MNPLLIGHLLCFPPACWQCRRLMDPLAGLLGAGSRPGFPYLCEACYAALPWLDGPGGDEAPRAPPAGVDRVWAACHYRHPVSHWVRTLKYTRRDALSRLLGHLLRHAPFAEAPLESADLVVPVPLHRRRVWRRGFNQSHLLAHRWLTARRGGAASPPLLHPAALTRRRHTRPQVELDAGARSANVEDAFALGDTGNGGARTIEGRRILLVDDVMTTGATLAACARVLREAGAARVEALVVTRAGGDDSPPAPQHAPEDGAAGRIRDGGAGMSRVSI